MGGFVKVFMREFAADIKSISSFLNSHVRCSRPKSEDGSLAELPAEVGRTLVEQLEVQRLKCNSLAFRPNYKSKGP